MTAAQMVQWVAWSYGKRIERPEQSEMILWEFTGFPSFWPTGRPQHDLFMQLHEFFCGRDLQ